MTIDSAPLVQHRAEDMAYSFFPSYIAIQYPNYRFAKHHLLIAQHLMDVEAGKTDRLMIFAPPRHGKSMEVSEFFPAWYMGRNPSNQIISLTYSFDRAGDVGRKVRDQMAEPLFQGIFPDCQISPDTKGANRVGTLQGGNYYSVGTSGGVTGRGAHLLLIDDPIKGKEDADSVISKHKLESMFNTVAYTRLMPGGAIILVMTRWAYDDLAGYLLEEKTHEGWTVLMLPAIAEHDGDILGRKAGEALWEDQYPLPALRKIRQTIGTRDWNALYQQQPLPSEGGMVSLEWFQRYSWRDLRGLYVALRMGADYKKLVKIYPQFDFRQIVCSWDTAFKEKEINDPSCCTVWGVGNDNNYYLLWVFNKQVGYPALKREAIRTHERNVKLFGFPPSKVPVLIEDRASGQSLIQDLKANTNIPVIPMKTPGSKVVRFDEVCPTIEAGRVFMPDKNAPWLVTAETQLVRFPHDKHDDIADSTSQFLRWAGRPRFVAGRNLKLWK